MKNLSILITMLILGVCQVLWAQNDSTKTKKQTKDEYENPNLNRGSNNTTGNMGHDNLKRLTRNGCVTTFDNRYEGIRGTPFLYDVWQPTNVWIEGNNGPIATESKFMVYEKQELRVKRPEGDSIILNNPQVIQFQFINQNRTFKRISHEQNALGEFMEVIYEGEKYSVFAKRYCKLIKAKAGGAYSEGVPFDQLIIEDEYYLRTDSHKKLTLFKTNRGSLLKVLPGQDDAMIKFQKDNKLKLDKEPDLARFVAHYESLAK